MSIIEAIRAFVKTCPFLKDGAIHVDYLGYEPTEYTVDGEPEETVVRQYADGGALKQFTFLFASREFYGEDTQSNLANSRFYEDFADWLGNMSKAGILPQLGEGLAAQEIEAISSGYLSDKTAGSARYQIKCRLTYYEGGF